MFDLLFDLAHDTDLEPSVRTRAARAFLRRADRHTVALPSCDWRSIQDIAAGITWRHMWA
jgi:hypothetical protein